MPAQSPLGRLEAAFLRPHRPAILLALFGMFLQTVIVLPLPVLHGRALDRLATGEVSAAYFPGLHVVALVTLGCLAGRAALAWWVGATMARVSQDVVLDLTISLHRKLQQLPLATLDRHETGGLMARVTSDIGTLMIFLSAGTLQLVTDLVLAAGITGVLAVLNWQLALNALAVIPVAAVVQAGFTRPQRRRSVETRVLFNDVYALLAERLPALRLVRAFGQDRAELARLDDRLSAHARSSRGWLWTIAGQVATTGFVGGLGTAAVVTAGAAMTAAGELSPGDLFSFYALTGLLYAPIVRLAQFHAGAAATRVAIDRIVGLLDEPTPTAGTISIPAEEVRGSVEVTDLTFRYLPGGPAVLEGVDVKIGAGGTVGVIGPTGSGKSTLLAVIANLYTAGRGIVRIDGRDATDCRPADLRRTVVLVPQRPVLFEGTIRSNLCYGVPDAHEFRLWQVLEAVELAGVVRSRPGGLDAQLGPGGTGLSGGQRQRLALARALLTVPAVLLLDDCTSALDAETEARVRANLKALLPGVTRFIVSHKPDAVRTSDEILVLDGGRIVERGTHDELVRLGGRYTGLVRLTSNAPETTVPVR